MIKDPDFKNVKASVILHNGSCYPCCDTADTPIHSRTVAVWHKGALVVIPLENVTRIEYFEGEE